MPNSLHGLLDAMIEHFIQNYFIIIKAPNYKYAPHCQISKRWTVTLLQGLEIHLPHQFIALIPCGYSEFSSTVMGLLQLQYDSNTSYR
ncbi:dipeptide transport system permease protein [Trichinella spiralis]|uniref:dipeptide transport system permease protein n=1 Tax=Trichinella spiralis TaxID=6334 RepID=UPI0001EFCE86|nr:dipeptide transport system permease protein [Trichinella spiralis]